MIRKIVFKIRVWTTILIPFILILRPADFFDRGETVCLSRLLAGIECYACGLTRATMHFIHFEFSTAWSYNKLVFIVVPMLFPLWVKAFYELNGKTLPGIWGKFT